MTFTKRSLSLFLTLTPGIGGRIVARILARNELLSRSPADFLALSPESLREEYRLNAKVVAAVCEERAARMAILQATEERLSALGVFWVTAADAHYPRMVEEMDPAAPGVLFYYGNTRLLEANTFCVLASRRTLPADLELLERLTEEGVLAGEVLVTGHDRPEYQRSAVVPLRWGAPRILCLDRGLFQVLGPDLKREAFASARLWRYEFDPRTDLVVSPFIPDSGFIGLNNKIRDRLVGCLSRRLDFVNVAPRGTMDSILRLALKTPRPTRISDRCLNYRQYTTQGCGVIKT